MYDMSPKRSFIERAVNMLNQDGMVIVFHREGLQIDSLICHRSASFPTTVVRVMDDDENLDRFASFIAGSTTHDKGNQTAWRKICRNLGQRDEIPLNELVFCAPEVMRVFTQHATALPKLTHHVPVVKDRPIKNREACLYRPAAVVRPNNVTQIQQCVHWAVEHDTSLTVIGGGHSGQCIWSNVVAVDMSTFNQIHIVQTEASAGSSPDPLIVVGVGCTTGDIIRTTMAANLTVPLGSRPSVSAGLWLQGGIGHLSRLHGLSCDSIIGAVIVSVVTAQVLCVGCVPVEHCPAEATRPQNEDDLLWALRGAGTNFGIVVSVTFKTHPAPVFDTRNWVVPLMDETDAPRKLKEFNAFAGTLPYECSLDAYLYWEHDQMHLGVAMIRVLTADSNSESVSAANALWGPPTDNKIVNSVGLFDTEMYISSLHGGHAGGKTSSFKRCVFLQGIGSFHIAKLLTSAIQTRPSTFCYLHLLHGGGAVSDVEPDATAFGCRDWDYACVITGVWPRDQDSTASARAAVSWVYEVANNLLGSSQGVYGADLGPDPRDTALAANAFGRNRTRLARLKRVLDPKNVLVYACPLPPPPKRQKLIILVTGKHGAGKDYCADLWVDWVDMFACEVLTAKSTGISVATKYEYATATSADSRLLLEDRAYKELHRVALTAFYNQQVQQRPNLPEEHFLSVVQEASDADVLFITGIKDEAPIAAFAHLIPECRLIEVHVRTDEKIRKDRRGGHMDSHGNNESASASAPSTHRPTFIFTNNTPGHTLAHKFAEQHLLPFFHADLERLTNMVRSVPDFPSPGITFRHVLDIAQHPDGLSLCTSLLQSHGSDWTNVDAVVSCEVGGLVFASALALRVHKPLVLVRQAGKLPPPVVNVQKKASYISSREQGDKKEKTFEMDGGVLENGASVVVVDDVLSSGETICAVLELLVKAGTYMLSFLPLRLRIYYPSGTATSRMLQRHLRWRMA